MELLRRMVLTAVNYPHWREMPSTPESGERALNTKEKEYGTVGAVIFHDVFKVMPASLAIIKSLPSDYQAKLYVLH